MVSKIVLIVFYIFLSHELRPSMAQTWVRAGYYWKSTYSYELPISNINSSLFTHLIYGFADLNTTTYQLSFPSPYDELLISNFTDTAKQKNPSVSTLLSIGGTNIAWSTFSSLLSNDSQRKSFIDSSIKMARLYGFQGLDLWYTHANTSNEMLNMGILFREWRTAAVQEARNSRQSQLILTASVKHLPNYSDSAIFPIDSTQKYLNWVHVVTCDYKKPTTTNFTAAPSALYDPSCINNTDYAIMAWINGGLSSNKLVFCLPLYGYAWELVNPQVNGIGAPARGPANKDEGGVSYNQIKRDYIEPYGPNITFNATYVVKYFTVGTSWIGFDDAEVVRIKISYAKEKKLLGYFVWQVYMDYNWELSRAAEEDRINFPTHESDQTRRSNRRKTVIVWATTATAVLLLGFAIVYCWMRKLKRKGMVDSAKQSNDEVPCGDFTKNDLNLVIYTWVEIEAATDRFSFRNKLGEGGFGPVYKGILPNGQVIAVKKLSKTSKQGYEEFKNEVMLTAKLQHVNLVKLLGYCIDGRQQMLVYEYMPNKSLDSYLFDPIRRHILDWEKRVQVIDGVTQGLIYLQEYSRLTIIHRDIKVSNVLLDGEMKPKISDFGMARIFSKDDLEADTSRIVGTLGYVSPEYIHNGRYSTKSDVYSFGVLLLQIISGKRISFLYGSNESQNLLEYANELWNVGKGMEFMDESLNDTYSSCKLLRCLQIGLLCVQENPVDRPSMLNISTMLKNENIDMMIPKKPAFWKQDQPNKSIVQLEGFSGSTSSINNVSMSDVLAR
ncbi:cysteine-rich receptor-like protein kinase 10 isoform X2 [Mangifera indica]|uniref:cysteine-rich receptor-like protein kinase 10 isoform X2 n=1 Tax=Mangifera indica TaxID=29780 RepID=UPI001CFA0820|nr:cysteine-rich receptor-like protein kinase 10 isoform X2 [Mangifera indica]